MPRTGGKCIVVSLMRANGLTVHALGRDVECDKIIEEAVRVNAAIIGTSALLTTTMSEQKKLQEALKSNGMSDKIFIMVGGAPVTPLAGRPGLVPVRMLKMLKLGKNTQ